MCDLQNRKTVQGVDMERDRQYLAEMKTLRCIEESGHSQPEQTQTETVTETKPGWDKGSGT